VAAAAIRLQALDRFSYGLDEILQTYWINGNWSFLWRSLRFDAVHPPLDYVIGRLLEPLRPADWARKLPDVLWGTLTVPLLGSLVARRAGRVAGIGSAALIAVAPFHVRYSQELRPYALGLFLLVMAVLALQSALERPTRIRVVILYVCVLATCYTLYLAAVALVIAAAALLVEEAFSEDAIHRRRARRFLAYSPLFAVGVALAYSPWIPVILDAARRTPPVPAEALTWPRVGRTLAFFAFAPEDGIPLSLPDAVFLLPAVIGLVSSLTRRGPRPFAIWSLGAFAAIEVLGRIHPHWYVTRRYLPAGIVLVPLAAIGLSRIFRIPRLRTVAAVLGVALLALDMRGLSGYFANGRADWRPLARFLRERPKEEWVFTENAYTSLCLAFYVVGPHSLLHEHKVGRPVRSLEGKPEVLVWSWPKGTTTWVVTGPGDHSEKLREWLAQFPSTPYPSAEGSVLYRLDDSGRDDAFRGSRAPRQ